MISPADEQRINEIIDARLKAERHEAADHLDRGLLLRKLAGSGAVDGSIPVWDNTDKFWKATTQPGGPLLYQTITTEASQTSNLTITCGFEPRMILAYGSTNDNSAQITMSMGAWVADEGTSGHRAHGSMSWTANESPANEQVRDTADAILWRLVGTTGTVLKSFAVASTSATGAVISRGTNDSAAFGLFLIFIG